MMDAVKDMLWGWVGEIRRAIRETPQRILDSLLDQVRLRHSIGRVAETVLPAFVVLLILAGSFWRAGVGAGLIVVGEWALYEWLLEPLGIAGHYWERSARDDETFSRP